MRLHVIFRSYGGENRKPRPAFYDKRTALASLLMASESSTVDHEITFLNDGPVPDDLLELMKSSGVVAGEERLGHLSSYLRAIDIAVESSWPDTDLVLFSEDDYLYHPSALDQLAGAAMSIPETDYLSPYGSTVADLAGSDVIDRLPVGGMEQPAWTVGEQTWVRGVAHTNTFAARLGVLRADRRLFRQATWPLRKRVHWDTEVCLAYQGYRPFPWGPALRDLVLPAGPGLERRLKSWALAPFKVTLNLRSYRRPSHRRLLALPDPSLAAHLEVGLVPASRDWESIEAASRAWLADRAQARG